MRSFGRSFARSWLRSASRSGAGSAARRCALAVATTLALPTPAAPGPDELVEAINTHRAAPGRCRGAEREMAGPLRPNEALDRAAAAPPPAIGEALRAGGYAASRWWVATLSGPGDAASALRLMVERDCTELGSARWSEVGVWRQGRQWRVLLAHPVLARDLAPPLEAGRQVLALVNAARAEARRCGGDGLPAAPPLAWDATLAHAAETHSRDMASRDDFSHASADGSQAAERVARLGYAWRTVGENIAAGHGSPAAVVDGWLASPGHCRNLMSDGFTQMGAAYAVDRASRSTIYWTQVFARPAASTGRPRARR